ncbi:O-antigen ligase family protein [Rosistilla oblonga]|uniref:O-antigen ligase family protein n=1 Tax=Rosistilla oblonga TaxID=2527990 RepID=UPI003A984C07
MPDEAHRSASETFTVCWRRLIAGLAAVIPAAAAWDYGGILPWSKWAIAAATAGLLIAVLPLLLLRRPSSRLAYGLPFLALAIWGYAAFQTIPLPGSLVSAIAPASHAAYSQWSEVTGHAAPSSMPISVAPWYTRGYLVLPACFAGFVLIATVVLRGDKNVLILLTLTTIAGVLTSYIGIADKINANELRGDLLDYADQGIPFGPFVNRNNAAGYLNLCLACTIGSLVYRHRKQQRDRKHDNRYQISGGGRWEKLQSRINNFARSTDNLSIVLIVFAIVIASGIFVSGSRGGMLASVAGTLVVCFRSVNRSRKFTALIAISIGLVGFGLLLGSIGMVSAVQERFAQVWGEEALQDGRLDHWQDSLVASANFFPGGAGLGTYRFAYLPFQRVGGSSWFLNADGMPFEWLLEGGLIVVGLILAGIAWTYRLLWNLAFYKNSPTDAAVATTAWFAIPSLMVSQSFDFGILLPANTLLAALILGAVCATIKPAVRSKKQGKSSGSKRRRSGSQSAKQTSSSPSKTSEYPQLEVSPDPHAPTTSYSVAKSSKPVGGGSYPSSRSTARSGASAAHKPPHPPRSAGQRAVDIGLALACWLGCFTTAGLAVRQQYAAAEADHVIRRFNAWRPDLVDAADKIDAIANETHELCERYPRNPDLLLTDAQVMLTQARAAMLRDAPEDLERQEFERLWQLTAPLLRRHQFHTQRATAPDHPLDWQSVLMPGESSELFLSARAQTVAALQYCPLNDQIYSLLLTLDFVDEGYVDTERWVNQLHQTGIRRPNTLHRLGVIASTYPGPETALPIWRDELQLVPERLQNVWQTIQQLQIDADLNTLVPDDPAALLTAADKLTTDPETREQLLSRIDAILSSEGRSSLKQLTSEDTFAPNDVEQFSPDTNKPLKHRVADDAQWHYFNARVAMLREDYSAAEDAYREAVQMKPGDLAWRQQFAHLLLQNGKQKEAVKQVERCLLQAPNDRRLLKLAAKFREAEVPPTDEATPAEEVEPTNEP